MAGKKVPWTVSEGGRRVLRGVAASLVGGTFLAHYLPQTVLIDNVRQVTQAYRKGQPIAVPAKVTSLVQEVMEEMNIEKEVRQGVTIYTTYGFDLFHAGSLRSTNGSLLGLPASMKWDSDLEFDGTGVVVNNTPVPWGSEAGQALKNSLILSKNAKKFAIARELSGLQRTQAVTQALIPSTALIVSYSISLGINKRLNLYGKPRFLRLFLYSLAGLFGYCVYILAMDVDSVASDGAGDGAAAAMGREYVEGGVEFYEKILQRNVALRELMGPDGEKNYTAKGNDEVLLRTRHLPFTVRHEGMKKCLEKYEEEEKKKKEEEEEEEKVKGR
ncbi:transmembrane protein 177-like [Scylla paramamosain]|uniref:transmembrane protein 177-like n=1 Tax=Scylla paramamosain TaxID=85552 RepID=UPI003083A530